MSHAAKRMRALIQLLYRGGWEKQHIINLFVVLDWMMRLPEHFTQQLWQTIDLIEEQEQMRYVMLTASSFRRNLASTVLQRRPQVGFYDFQ